MMSENLETDANASGFSYNVEDQAYSLYVWEESISVLQTCIFWYYKILIPL